MTHLKISDIEHLLTSKDDHELLSCMEQGYLLHKDYHSLFDLRMLRKKWELGLPLGYPTMFKDVPQELRTNFEETYTIEAKRIGGLFLNEGKIPDAWLYYRILGDQKPVYDALEMLPLPRESNDEIEELIHLAIYQKVHPVKGLQLMLATSGMCNTVTACDQAFPDLTTNQRIEIAKILVNEMYAELVQSLHREIRKKVPLLPPGKLSLEELISGREWLFEDDNYHVDVSHLNAVVRFSRTLNKEHSELELARQLALYGSQLSRTLQYSGEVPFTDFYVAHLNYFKVIRQDSAELGLNYFKQQLNDETDQLDQQLIALVLLDLYIRTGNIAIATNIAQEYLADVPASQGFSFKEFCLEHQQYAALKEYAQNEDNPFLYLTATLELNRQR